MRKNITYNITKKVRVENSPFKIGIYVFKDRNRILIEDLETGKAVETDSYSINNYVKLGKTETDWERSFDNTYIRFHEGRPEYFMSHYPEQNRYANLTIDIVKKMCPFFTIKEVMNPTTNMRVIMIDNEITPEKKEEKTYNYLFKNVKEFEVPNFKLEMVESERTRFVNEDFTPLKIPQITCRVPLFQLFSILRPKINLYEYEQKIHYDYNHNLTIMKMDNKFYRFPYGNTSDSDQMCLGSYRVPQKNIQPDSIQDLSYAQIITTVFNGDYNPHIKFNNQIPTTFDINWIREKINKNDFEVSFMDILFYISQCETLEEINKKLFILTPNVPKNILDFETKLLKILNPARAEEASQESFTIGHEEDVGEEVAGPEPARMDFRFVAPTRETNRFRIPDEVADLPRAETLRVRLTEPVRAADGFIVPRQNADGNWVIMPDTTGNETTLPINNVNYNLYATTAWTTTGNQTYYTDGTTGDQRRITPQLHIMDDVEHPPTQRVDPITQQDLQEEIHPEDIDPRTVEEIYDDLVTERVIGQALHPQVSDHDRRLMEEIARSIELRRENAVHPASVEQGIREIGEVIGGIDLATNPHIQIFNPNPGNVSNIRITPEGDLDLGIPQETRNEITLVENPPTLDEIQEELDNRPVTDIPIQIVDYPADLIRVDEQLQQTPDIQNHEHQINVTNLRTDEVQTMNFNPDTIIITEQENGVQENDTNRETVTETQRV